MAPKKAAPKKAAAKKPAATPKPVDRTDKYGQSGFGQTARSLARQESARTEKALNVFAASTGKDIMRGDFGKLTPAERKRLKSMIAQAEKRPIKKKK
jgi:hypothetical protein